ncbi:MAG TPA: phosphoribosyltransferase family protein [Pirellulales bacterium]|jgi:predicted phosphoribosyltransferase|nr:phosphoribosyltransferase family protein [Pirellulales bacterium]
MKRYLDRHDAGRQLAAQLQPLAGRDDVVVFALPRGGVPVGYEVAKALGAPLEAFMVRKLGVPGHEELAMGAIAAGHAPVLNHDLIERLKISPAAVSAVVEREARELARREAAYHAGQPPVAPAGRVVILVDDGLATGSTMQAAVRALEQPSRVVVAVPVAAADTVARLRAEGLEIVCPWVPKAFYAVGLWYEDFEQTTDEEIRELLTTSTPT